jgi:hypothetical protein
MTSKADFDEQEWPRIVRAPRVTGMSITLADPGADQGSRGSMAIKTPTNPPSTEQLLADVALDIRTMGQSPRRFPPRTRPAPGEHAIDELRGVHQLVGATNAEPSGGPPAFGPWIKQSAQAAAHAAAQDGFLGFGFEQVSQREKDMLERVRAPVSV